MNMLPTLPKNVKEYKEEKQGRSSIFILKMKKENGSIFHQHRIYMAQKGVLYWTLQI